MIVSIDRFREGRGSRGFPWMSFPTATPLERASSRSGDWPLVSSAKPPTAVDEVNASNGTQP
jgi:hypothetical protein